MKHSDEVLFAAQKFDFNPIQKNNVPRLTMRDAVAKATDDFKLS